MPFYTQSTAYVYTFDAATGALSSELMRVPGGRCDKSAAAMDTGRVLRTLGKDTQGLVDEVLLPRGEFVYFVERKAALGTAMNESESEKENEGAAAGRSRAVRKAMREVREVELMARKLEAEMMAMEEEPECTMMGKRGVVEVDSEDEDESDDESDDESVWSDDDEEESEGEVDSDDEDEMALQAAEAFAKKDEEDWEVALFGKYEDETTHMDTDDIMDAEDDKRTPPVVDVPTTAEQWTCEDDREFMEIPLATTDLDPSGYDASAKATPTRTKTEADTRTRTRAEADVDHRADTRTSADTRMRAEADVNPRADTRTGADLRISADSRISADPGISDDLRTSADADGTKVKAKPIVPMRTSRADGTPRMATATRTRTDGPAPRIASVQVSRIKAIAGDVLNVFRGKKRKADRDGDEDDNEDAKGTPLDHSPGALAVTKTRTLAGLKFKKMETCLSNLGPTGTIAGKIRTASAGSHTKADDQKPPPRTTDPGLTGRKRKNDDKEEGELSEDDDDVPLVKRARTMQAPRTSDHGGSKPERGARKRWDDRRWGQRKMSGTMGQRRSQMAQLGR